MMKVNRSDVFGIECNDNVQTWDVECYVSYYEDNVLKEFNFTKEVDKLGFARLFKDPHLVYIYWRGNGWELQSDSGWKRVGFDF